MNECVLFIDIDKLTGNSVSYMMSLLGINASTNGVPSVTLTPYELESAVSQIAAQLMWIGVLLRIIDIVSLSIQFHS